MSSSQRPSSHHSQSGITERWTHNEHSLRNPSSFMEIGLRVPMTVENVSDPTVLTDADTLVLNLDSPRDNGQPRSSVSRDRDFLERVLTASPLEHSARRMMVLLEEPMRVPSSHIGSDNRASPSEQSSGSGELRIIDFSLPEEFPQAQVTELPHPSNSKVLTMVVDTECSHPHEIEVDATCFYPNIDMYLPEVNRRGVYDRGPSMLHLNSYTVTRERLRIKSHLLSLKLYADRRHRLDTEGIRVEDFDVMFYGTEDDPVVAGETTRSRFGTISHFLPITITRLDQDPNSSARTHTTDGLYRPWIKPVTRPMADDIFHNVSIVEDADGKPFALHAMVNSRDVRDPDTDEWDAPNGGSGASNDDDDGGARAIGRAFAARKSSCKDEHTDQGSAHTL